MFSKISVSVNLPLGVNTRSHSNLPLG